MKRILLIFMFGLLAGCASKPLPVQRKPVQSAIPALGKQKPAPSTNITIIHIRPEARDYVHP